MLSQRQQVDIFDGRQLVLPGTNPLAVAREIAAVERNTDRVALLCWSWPEKAELDGVLAISVGNILSKSPMTSLQEAIHLCVKHAIHRRQCIIVSAFELSDEDLVWLHGMQTGVVICLP